MASQFPTNLDTVSNYGLLTNNYSTTLNGAISDSATTITVVNAGPIISPGGFYITIESEIIFCSGKSGNDLIVSQRGALGTAAASHANAIAVTMYVVNGNINDLVSSIIALQTQVGKNPSPDAGSLRYAAIEIPDSVLSAASTGNVGANSTTDMAKGTSGSNAPWKMPFDGKITALSVSMTAPRTSGTLVFQCYINEVAQNGVGQTLTIAGTNTTTLHVVFGTPINFNAGDTLNIRTVTTGFAPTSGRATGCIFWKRR